MKEIPILLYQNIGNYPENMMEDGIFPETFERQMNYIAENGYNIVSLRQALDHINKRISILKINVHGNIFASIRSIRWPIKYRYSGTGSKEIMGRKKGVRASIFNFLYPIFSLSTEIHQKAIARLGFLWDYYP